MENGDLQQLMREVLDKEPEAALPCNLPYKWLGMLGRDLEMLLQEQDESFNYLDAPLAIVIHILHGKHGNKKNEISFSEGELLEYLQYLRIEIALELVRRSAGIDTKPATIETIFTDRFS